MIASYIYFCQSESKSRMGRGGEDVVLLFGIGGGEGMGEGSPYAILCYICHKEAFYTRQTDPHIHHPWEGRTR